MKSAKPTAAANAFYRVEISREAVGSRAWLIERIAKR